MLWLPLFSLVTMAEAEILSGIDPVPIVSQEPFVVDEVNVYARRGAALVPPEIELSGIEIDALAAWDIGEVLQRVTEIYNIREAPLIVINGKIVANSGVFTSFPPDALVRAEVLPAEASALYGGAPGQRVVNLVLQRQFQSYDGRASGGRPTQSGMSSLSSDIRRSEINGEKTLQLGARISRDTALRADERSRDQSTGRIAGNVTLRPAVDVAALSLSATRPMGEWSTVLNLNGQVRESSSRIRFGDEIIDSIRRNESLGGTVGLSGKPMSWQVQLNATGQVTRSNDSGFGGLSSELYMLGLNGSAVRTLMDLPAGPMVLSLNSNLMGNRSTVERDQRETINRFQAQEARGSLALPLSKANSSENLLPGMGDMLLTVGGGVRNTGSGTGDEVNTSLSWTPRQKIRLSGFWSSANDGIADNLRSEPLYYDTPRVVFDFRTGQAVEIVPIMGGNPNLQQPRSERLSLSASLGPFTRWSLSVNLGYLSDRMTNGIGSLPDLTEDVEAVFPERFQRDLDGRLISVDYRPLNVGSTLTEGLASSLNFNLPRPSGGVAREQGIVRLALSHNYRMRSSMSLATDLPKLDRLKGDGGGISQQDARLMIDARKGAWGLNVSSRWQDGYRTRRKSGVDGDGDLIVGDLTIVDFTLSFQMISQRLGHEQSGDASRRRSSGLQLNFQVTNLFDERPSARLGNGTIAPGYGRDIQDPIGRTVRLTLQRRF